MLAGANPIFSSLTTSFCNFFWDGAEVENEALNKTWRKIKTGALKIKHNYMTCISCLKL